MEIFDSCPLKYTHGERWTLPCASERTVSARTHAHTHVHTHACTHVRVCTCAGRTCCMPVSLGLDLCVQQLQHRSVIDIGGAHQFPRRAHSRSQPASQPTNQPTYLPTYLPTTITRLLSSYRSYITREDDYSLGTLTGWLMFAVRARARWSSRPFSPRSFKLTSQIRFGLS